MSNKLKVIALSLLVIGLIHLGYKTVDNEGYVKQRSLYELFFPQVESAYRYSIIKSIQAGTITVSAATSNTATITSVVTGNTRLIYLGNTYSVADQQSDQAFCYIVLTNGTTVTANKGAATGSTTTSFQVVEYYSNVFKSMQSGTIAIGNETSHTATITSVNTAKAELNFLGHIISGNSNHDILLPNLVLTNATTVTASTNSASGNTRTISYQVIEWK